MERYHDNDKTMYLYWLARREDALQALTIAEQQLKYFTEKPTITEQEWTDAWNAEQRPETD